MMKLRGKQLGVTLGGEQILDDVNFDLKAGEMLGLIGPNGAGKSTLLRTLVGLLTPDSGSIALDEIDYEKMDPQLRAKRIAYLAQSGAAHWPMTVERIVSLGRLPHLSDWQRLTQHDAEIVEGLMQQTDIVQYKDRRINTLSGGERARVLLARALASEPEILLADEPVAALDLAHQLEVMSLLRHYCEQGGAVVVVLHDLRLAAHYCHRLQLLDHGKVVADGAAAEVLTEQNMKDVFGIKVREGTGPISETFILPWQRQI